MRTLNIVVLVVIIGCSMGLPFYSKRELAPSLTLQRLNSLKDSIDQLNDIKKIMRCQEKASRSRSKRMLSPSQRLSDLIDPLFLQKRMLAPSQRLSEMIDPLFLQKRMLSPAFRLSEMIDPLILGNGRNKRMLSPSVRLQEMINPLAFQLPNKRMIAPSVRLSELIDPLVTTQNTPINNKQKIEEEEEKENEEEEEYYDDPCIAFYNGQQLYF